MGKTHVAVEQNYKDLKQSCTSQDFAGDMKVKKAPIALLYKTAAILFSFHVCLQSDGQVKM